MGSTNNRDNVPQRQYIQVMTSILWTKPRVTFMFHTVKLTLYEGYLLVILIGQCESEVIEPERSSRIGGIYELCELRLPDGPCPRNRYPSPRRVTYPRLSIPHLHNGLTYPIVYKRQP